MRERLKTLEQELDDLLNLAPIGNDCTNNENQMYSDMATLRNSIEAVLSEDKELVNSAPLTNKKIGEHYAKHLTSLVKASGRELIRRAEDLVGCGDLINDFSIYLYFPQDSVPTIEVTREHISKESYQVIVESRHGDRVV